ncbi:MAG: type II toxin-antitoxin system VapB family antitoxin [Chloroflexota bacterium]
MRTTLVLDDLLLRRAKRRAADRNMTVSELVNEALREVLDRAEPVAPPFSMVKYGQGSGQVRHEPAEFARDLDDEGRRRLR